MRTSVTLLGGLAALTLSACGGSNHPAGGGTSPATGAVSAGQNTSSGSSSAGSGAASATGSRPPSSAGGGTPLCTAAVLSLAFLGQQGATGHGELGLSLRNHSSHSCHTFGYPGIQFEGASGGLLPTTTIRSTRDFFGTSTLRRLLVPPGGEVSFRIGVTHGVVNPGACTTAAALQVIAPDDTATLRVHIPGGAYECRTATVSPLQRGTSAFF